MKWTDSRTGKEWTVRSTAILGSGRTPSEPATHSIIFWRPDESYRLPVERPVDWDVTDQDPDDLAGYLDRAREG